MTDTPLMPIVPASDERPRVLVAIVHNLGVVDREACRSLMSLGWGNRVERAKVAHDLEEISFAWYTRLPRVDALRDYALSQAIADGFTHLVFLDADMVHPDDLFLRLLAHVRTGAVVTGFYTQRMFPFAPIALREGQAHESGAYRQYRYDAEYTDVDADGLRDEEVVGMGCTLIPLALVQALGPRPWFEYRDTVEGWPMISEDVPFCEKVRGAGGRICLDPSIKCGHVYTDIATEAHWQRYVAVHAATAEKLQDVVTVRVVDAPEPVLEPVAEA